MNNVYAELGTTFATCAVANPRFAACLIGQFVNEMGPDNVVWGSDSVWYGSPQWQIEAMRRLEIPDDVMKKMGLEDQARRRRTARSSARSSATNSARLYNYKIQADYDRLNNDKIAQIKSHYEKEQIGRNNKFYGYIAKPA